MELGLIGRRAAVAAGTAGLGWEAARALASEGASVVLCGRDAERAEDAARRIGHGALGVGADVGSPEGAAGFVEQAAAMLGGLDILVTNAGGPPPGTFETTELAAYEKALSLNLLSVVAMCKAAIPGMCDQGWGRVVAITSISVRQPIANLITSNTARAGATGFVKTVATEVARHGVTVNSLQPGYHATDRVRALVGHDMSSLAAQIPAGTVGDPADFGAIVAFLCSDQARFITGAAIPVDGGAAGGLQ